MDSKSARRLKQKLGIATEILMWELSDMWGTSALRQVTVSVSLSSIYGRAAEKFRSIIGRDSTEIAPEQRRAVSQITEWHYYERLIKKGRRWNRL
jgi:hypothetical protein